MNSLAQAAPAQIPLPARLCLIVTGFAVAILYVLIASATIDGIRHAIATHIFYARSDFAAATWTAGRALRTGDIAGLYREAWLYPPTMGLLAVPMSLLPLPFAFWAWMGGTTLLSAILLRRAGLPVAVVLAGLCGPAAFYNLLLGQNGELTAGLLVAALLTLRRRPVSAGLLAGCLCVKPQLGALLPVVLAANRRLAPCLAAGAAVFALAALATAAFGWRSWLLFLTIGQPTAHRQLVAPYGGEYQLAAYSVFMMARSLGLGVAAAFACQGAAAAAAAICAWRLWRRPPADPARCVLLTVCLAMLAVPFGFSYDLIGFSVAVAAMPGRGPPPLWPVWAALWLWPGLTILIAVKTHLVLLPLAACAGILAAWPRAFAGARLAKPKRFVKRLSRTPL